jgi:NAD(P)-dependent dehydrogenase (short-subunit alcohol dehydrogenase family)
VAVVLITGCSSGIGLETALAFARHGDTTVATMRDPARDGLLLARAGVEGLEVDVMTLDVCDDASVMHAVAEVEARHGPVGVLVDNAGVAFTGPVETMDLDRARTALETNFWGPVRMMRAVLPSMRARRAGVIVQVTSTAARVPGAAYQGFYAASKHALAALTEAMVTELEPFGVRLACVAPGAYATDVFDKVGWGEIDDGDPYAADQAWMTAHYLHHGGVPPGDPAVVAARIVGIVDDPSAPLHHLVGDDAEMYVELVGRAGSLEAWLARSASLAEGSVGPRPTVAPSADEAER